MFARSLRLAKIAGFAAAVCFGSASTAQAGDWGLSIGLGDGGFHAGYVRAGRHGVAIGVRHDRPAYRYETRTIWVEPVYDERTYTVEVPAVYEDRTLPVYDRYGRKIGYRTERVLIRPTQVEYRTERVLVRGGYYKTVTVQVPVANVYYPRHRSGLHVDFAYDHHRHHRHHVRPFKRLKRAVRYLRHHRY